jgi:hypothetical protein
MRIPATTRAMGRSIADKKPIGNSGRDRKGRIKPNQTPMKLSKRSVDPHRLASIKNGQSRGQKVNKLRPGAVHTSWGNPRILRGKTAGQDHILQFATAAGIFSCFFLIAAAGLQSLKNIRQTSSATTAGSATEDSTSTLANVNGASNLATWLWVKTGTTGLTSILACLLRSYWVWSNYNGSSKLSSYCFVMCMDWLFGIVVMIAMINNYIEHGFWWFGFISLLLFTAASLRTIFDLVYASIKRNNEKKEEKEEKEEKKEQKEREEKDDEVAAGTKAVEPAVISIAESDEPSAPPLSPSSKSNQHTSEFTNIQNIVQPPAPSSPVKMYHPPILLEESEIMNQQMFEDKWLKLPQLSSRNHTFMPPLPPIGDIKMHLKER